MAAAQRAAAQAQAAADVVARAAAGGSSTSVTAGPSKGAGPAESTATPAAGPKPAVPRAPRAMREHQARQQAARAAKTSDPPASTPSNSSTTASSATAPSVARPPPTPRKARPVITAPTRQFEAALSGAGVAIVDPSASGGDRRTRRERGRERDKNRDKQSVEKNPAEGIAARENDDPGPVAVRAAGSEETAGSPKAKVPMILQRPDPASVSVLQQLGEQSPAVSSVAETGGMVPVRNTPSAGEVPESGPVRGSGRRGRGRGRGGHRGGT